MLMWFVLGAIFVSLLCLVYHDYRRDYHRLEDMYKVKLPFLCHVTLADEPDKIIWGYRRYRFIRQDGGKDRRRALNIKITYPTVIVVNQFKVYILNLKEGKRVFRRLQDYMYLPLGDIPGWGDIRKDLWRFFRGRRVRFVRHIAHLFDRYGWQTELLYEKDWDMLIQRNGYYYAVYCVFKEGIAYTPDVQRIPRLSEGVTPVVATNNGFSNGALEYAKAHGILLMGKKQIDMSFDCDCIIFVGRQG